MNARRGFGLLWGVLTVAIAGTAAWFAYHAGLATTIATTRVSDAAAVVPPAYYYHWDGYGFGFFPLLLFVLLIVFLFRGRRRHWGWGYGGGWGHGYGHGQPGGPQGSDLPPPIEERMKAWHEKAHGATAEPHEPS